MEATPDESSRDGIGGALVVCNIIIVIFAAFCMACVFPCFRDIVVNPIVRKISDMEEAARKEDKKKEQMAESRIHNWTVFKVGGV